MHVYILHNLWGNGTRPVSLKKLDAISTEPPPLRIRAVMVPNHHRAAMRSSKDQGLFLLVRRVDDGQGFGSRSLPVVVVKTLSTAALFDPGTSSTTTMVVTRHVGRQWRRKQGVGTRVVVVILTRGRVGFVPCLTP